MARQAKLTPQQQLPTLEAAIAAHEAFRRYASDPFAELGAREAEHAEKIIRKDLKNVIDAEVLGAEAPVEDLQALSARVIKNAKLLRNAMDAAGVTNLPKVKLTQSSAAPSAEALLTSASGTKDPVVSAVIPRLRKDLARLLEAQKRVAAGGHEAFDLKVSAAAKQAWKHLDNAYDLLGICMRNADVAVDPVYQSRPSTRTDLRLKLQVAPKKAKAVRASAKGKGGKSKKSDSTQQSAGNPPHSQTPAPPPTPPAPAPGT